jgi:FAD/FMN-containing dehydrogenase
MTIGGGVIFADIFDILYAAGKEIRKDLILLKLYYMEKMLTKIISETGSGSCVGMVGATLGGGIGRLQGLHGLILDALVSVEIVTAAGNLITASRQENAGLFWALRGTGANFGIITSATYTVYNATNGGQFFNADFAFLPSASTKYWEILQSFDETLPAALSLTTSVRYNATAGLVSSLDRILLFYITLN